MPLSINQIPIPVPSSTDPANFSARGDAVFGAFPNFITQTNAVASEAAANRDSAEASKTAAAISETNAATYAANATTSANNASSSSTAPLWVSGTTYAVNDKRVSPITGQVYRRKTAGAGTTDPSLDSTNWYAVLLDADTQYPSIKPTLNLDFANSGKLDPRITFTRASTATYYDGKTFAKAEENLLTYSNDPGATWTAISGGATLTSNAGVAPDGTSTATSVNVTNYGIRRSFSFTSGVQYTISAYLRSVSGDTTFSADLQNAQVSPTFTLTSSWQRFTWTVTASAAHTWLDFQLAGAGVFEVWGVQIEQRSQATALTPTTTQPITKYQPVLKTASNNEPRFDYDPVTLEAKGLLIEEQRTNLLLWSSSFDNAYWDKLNVTILPSTTLAPDGTLTASKLIPTSTSTSSHLLYKTVTIASQTTSIYAKAGEYSSLTLQLTGGGFGSKAVFNLSTGVVTSAPGPGVATIIHVGNGWYRCSLNDATATGTPILRVYVGNDSTSYAGDGYSGIYIWGAQLEAGAFATSYIPTTSTPVTRQADSAVMTGTNFSSWYNQGEGTFYGEMTSSAALTGSSNRDIIIEIAPDLLAEDLIGIGKNYAGGSPNLVFVGVKKSGVFDAYFANSATISAGVPYKAAAAIRDNDVALSVNGVQSTTDTSVNIPKNVTQARIGFTINGATSNGHIKRITYYPKRLPNYQLQILTK